MTAKTTQARAPRLQDENASVGELELEMPKLQRNTLNEEVYQQLKHALMTGRIAPGSTMTIRSLAKSFGISPMPVREALRRLVAEHVLVLLPNRSVSLPGDFDNERVDARFVHGVLTVTLPKPERVKPRQISVKTQ